MIQPALITLASVKEWLGADGKPYPPTSDSLLTRLIAAVSTWAAQYLNAPIAPVTFTEVYNGNGMPQLTLRQQPVIAVRTLAVGSTTIAARTVQGGTGYVSDAASVYIGSGYFGFCRDVQNVQVTYDAGYQTSDAEVVPAGTPYMISGSSLSRPWNTDRGVAYATGAAFTLVTVAPTVAGTYRVTTDAQGNIVYTFAAADANAAIVVTYGFTPEDVAQALIEIVGEAFKSRNRIGENSQNLGHGQIVSFSQKDMNARIKMMLNNYKNVVPVG